MTRVDSCTGAETCEAAAHPHLALGADLTALGAAAAVALLDLAEHSSPQHHILHHDASTPGLLTPVL